MTSKEKMLKRLWDMGLAIPENAIIVQTYAGRHQKAQGAWSWSVGTSTPPWPRVGIGSQWPIGQLLRGYLVADQQHSIGDWHIYPNTESDSDVVESR